MMNSKVMYIEIKTDGLRGEGCIGRVQYSKTGRTLYYKDRTLVPSKSTPLKANYFDEKSLEDFWVSGPKKNGEDSLYPSVVTIDEGVREEYWSQVRKQPSNILLGSYKSKGKPKSEREKIEKGLRRRQMDNGWMPN